MLPVEFASDDATPDGGGWIIHGRVFAENPRRLVREPEREMVRIWAFTRTGGFGGARLLPDRGGIMDQAAVMLDALNVMDDQAAELTPKPQHRREE